MATPVKTAVGTWRVQIEIAGIRESSTHRTRKEAAEWAFLRSQEIREGAGKAVSTKTLEDALDEYKDKVSEHHRGWAKEQIRLEAFKKQPQFPGKVRLAKLTAGDIANWRDARLKANARGTVLRDMGLLSAVLETARLEWGWVDKNVMRDVRKPANPDHRTRLITDEEVRKMLEALGHGGPVRSVSQSVAVAFLLALETGMRAGEICGLRWADIHASWCDLPITKNGTRRQVPLTHKALELVTMLEGFDSETVFGLKSQTLDTMFRRARDRAKLSGFTFHDSRHTAATRIGASGRIQLLEMCRMFGWKNPKQALIYFNLTAADLAKKLSGEAPNPKPH